MSASHRYQASRALQVCYKSISTLFVVGGAGQDILRNRKLGKIVPHHLRFNLYGVELLPRVDTNHASNHLRHNDHVPQMRLDGVRFLIRLGFLLRLSQLFDQAHGTTLETAIEPTASARMYNIAELFGGEVEESVMVSDVQVCREFVTPRRTAQGQFRGRKIF